VQCRYEEGELLRSVELCVRSGGSVLVRGAAGAGKTALLRTICGLWPMGERRVPLGTGSVALGTGSDGLGTESVPLGTGSDGFAQTEESSAELICVPPLWNAAARLAGSPTYLVLPQAAPLRHGMRTSLLEQVA
jgi:ABC-type cobalamin/Fe3+-siderophores transport system ATPase subunit